MSHLIPCLPASAEENAGHAGLARQYYLQLGQLLTSVSVTVTMPCAEFWPYLAHPSLLCNTALSVHGSNDLQLGRVLMSVTVLTPCIDAFMP